MILIPTLSLRTLKKISITLVLFANHPNVHIIKNQKLNQK